MQHKIFVENILCCTVTRFIAYLRSSLKHGRKKEFITHIWFCCIYFVLEYTFNFVMRMTKSIHPSDKRDFGNYLS